MAKLFLSYSRKDAVKAQRFAAWLESEGHDVWRDDDDIGGGTSFSTEIEKALNECDVVLVLWSAVSVRSSWVRDEAAWGRDAGKLIPFSLDGTEPPLGFRQFQTTLLSNWKGKGAPPQAEPIRAAIGRISASSAQASPNRKQSAELKKHDLRSLWITAAVVLVLGAAISGFMWVTRSASRGITIAVSASPNSSDASAAADYANVAAADLASYLPTRSEDATVIAPADVDGRTGGYRIQIAAGRHGDGADASVTLSDRNGRSVLWSNSWNVPDASAIGLREKVSQAVSQAALCLAKARGGSTQLEQPALGLFIGSCTSLFDPNTSEAQLEATSERIVKLAPTFAEGWASVAMGRAIYAESQQDRNGIADPRAVQSAREAIATARKLNRHSGFPYLAEWHLVRHDPLQSLALLDKAIEVDPDEPVLYARLSNSLMSVGRMSDAVQAARRATELDPLWSFTRESYINALTYAGQFSRAVADIADARRKWPNNQEIDSAEFDYQYRYGDPRAAEKLLPRVLDYSDAQLAAYRKVIAARLDPSPAKINDAVASFGTGERMDARSANLYLLALGLFGKVDEAYRLLSDRNVLPLIGPDILFRPEFARLRAEARFMQLPARIGLVRYWRQSGRWPDFCTSEKLSYDCKTEAAKYG